MENRESEKGWKQETLSVPKAFLTKGLRLKGQICPDPKEASPGFYKQESEF